MANVNVEINGISINVPKETTILSAASMLGIEIPTLCYLKDLTPDGSCRICVVEVEGGRRKGLVTACSEHCADGMKVKTHSEPVIEARKFILDMLLGHHDMKCLTCTQAGKCLLQDYGFELGIEHKGLGGPKTNYEVDKTNPFFDFDPNQCIMCRKCERVCESLQCRNTISLTDRSYDTRIGIAFGKPWMDSNCESCGNCVQNCPTGALSNKQTISKFRHWELDRVRTTCPHCGTGCQYDLLLHKGKIVGTEGVDGPANRGMLCVKGRYASYNFINHPDRLKYPLIKKNGKFERASWDEALSLITSKLTEIKDAYGPDAIGGFSCSRSTNEDNYLFQKMMRAAIGTNNVDNCARLCHAPSVHGLAITLGSGAMTNPIRDILVNPDVIFLIGSNPTEAHPVIGIQIRQAVQNGAKLIIVDPRKIDLIDYSHMHLQIKPGTNVAFANGIMNVIINHGLEDKDYIKNRTEGYEEMKEIVKDYTPEKVAEICNIDKEDLIKAALLYANAEKAPIIYCLGVTEHSTGTEGVMSMSNMALLVGKIGKEGCGVNPLRGQNNVQGACDMGCMPYDFPGYQKVANPEVIEKFEKAWNCKLSTKQGMVSTQMIPAAKEGEVKALYIFGEDPVVTDPDTNHVISAIENLDFLVVQELFMTETAQYADVILPGASYAQKEGTFTNTERRVQRVRKAVELEGEMRLDSEILCDVMTRLGYDCKYENEADIMKEIASLTPTFAGISHERLDSGESLQWPCFDDCHPGTPILHTDTFTKGIGYFYPARYKESNETPDEEFPIIMVTGRMLYHYNAGAMTRRNEGLNQICGESYIEINHADAIRLEIEEGDKVKVTSRRGELITNARVGDIVSEREVFMTFHFEDGNVNKVTNSATDDIAKIPEYKVCAVKLEKV